MDIGRCDPAILEKCVYALTLLGDLAEPPSNCSMWRIAQTVNAEAHYYWHLSLSL